MRIRSRRPAVIAIAAAFVALGACSPTANTLGGWSAEVLESPFPATMTNVHAPHNRRCDDQYGCWIVFDVSVTNPTDRAAQVAKCVVALDDANAVREVRWTLPG